MRTDPLGDAWDFLVGAQPDQAALGDWRWLLVLLFAALLVGSGVSALAVWRREPGQGAAPFWAWLFRTLTGIMWFQGALWKLPFPVSDGFRDWVEQMPGSAAWPPIGDALAGLLRPNLAWVDPAVFMVEMGLAISLMLGLFVRPVATLGAIYVVALWIAFYRHPNQWPWGYVFLAALLGMFAIVGGRRSLGLDALSVPVTRLRSRALVAKN